MRVHILATVRQADLLPMALLVFRTVRTGFPAAEIVVHGNGLAEPHQRVVAQHAAMVGGAFRNGALQAHGCWIERLLSVESEPFWICDTDVVFFAPVEEWFRGSGALFAGRQEPRYLEPLTELEHVARLHPSLMWFNVGPLRAAMRSWPPGGPQCEFLNTIECPLIRWHYMPRLGRPPLFYDTCAGLHQALGGTAFGEEQNQAFAHLFSGTYLDVLSKTLDLRPLHGAVWRDPEVARGLWPEQQEWYRKQAMDNV